MANVIDTYGFDALGNRVDIDIIDGVSYIDGTNNRIGEGTTVQTKGGIYKLIDGVGQLVSDHNKKVVSNESELKYLSNIPFAGSGVLGGSVGDFMDVFKNYMSGTLTQHQAQDIAKEVVIVSDRNRNINNGDDEMVNEEVKIYAENYYKNKTAFDWMDNNKLWIFGSIVALLGITILND